MRRKKLVCPMWPLGRKLGPVRRNCKKAYLKVVSNKENYLKTEGMTQGSMEAYKGSLDILLWEYCTKESTGSWPHWSSWFSLHLVWNVTSTWIASSNLGLSTLLKDQACIWDDTVLDSRAGSWAQAPWATLPLAAKCWGRCGECRD